MDTLNWWLTLTLVVFLYDRLVQVDAIFATEWPISASKFENSDVEFYCEVHDKDSSSEIVWFTDMDHTDNFVTLTFANETSEIDLGNNGGQHSIEYELTTDGIHKLTYRISGIKEADKGLYACGFVPLPVPSSISPDNVLGDYATLEVLVPPNDSHPRCNFTANDSLSLSQNSAITVSLSCGITGGKPAPELTWYKIDTPITNGLIQADLTLTLDANDNGVEFLCIARGKSLSEEASCSVTPLKIPPSASVTSSSTQITPGGNVSLSCVGQGLPMVSEIEWYINGVSVDEIEDLHFEIFDNETESSSELNIFNVQLERANNVIDCVVILPSGLNSKASINLVQEKNGDSSLLSIPLLPIIGAVSGLLVAILIIFIVFCICRSSSKRDDLEGIYQSGEPIDTHAHINPYEETAIDADEDLQQVQSGEGYVINQLPGGPRSATMRSEHPYATIQRDEYLAFSPAS